MTAAVQVPAKSGYQGTERLLWGIVLGVVTFWLFAGTVGTVARNMLLEINGQYTDPAAGTWDNPYLSLNQMNLGGSGRASR